MAINSDPDAPDFLKIREECLECLQEVLAHREKTIQELKEILKKIEESSKDKSLGNIVKIASSAGGLFGSGLAILGLALAPVTFGGSLAVSAVGGAVGTLSGVAGVGADYFVSNDNKKKAQELCDADLENVRRLEVLGEKYEKLLNKLSDKNCEPKIKTLRDVHDTIVQIVKVCKKAYSWAKKIPCRVTNAGVRITDTALDATKAAMSGSSIVRAGARVMKGAGIVAAVVTVPMDMYTLKTSYDVYNGKSSSGDAEAVKEMIVKLEEGRDLLQKEIRKLSEA